MNSNHQFAKIIAILMLFLISLFVLPFLGWITISPEDIIGGHADPQQWTIFWEIRLPRILLAAVIGSGLSVSGLVTQSILRNPLATPYTLGISSGSALGAVVAIKLSLDIYFFGFSSILLFSFAGALFTAVVIYMLAMHRRKISTYVLILAGVTISYLISAINLFIQFLADYTETRQMVRWMMGGLETIGYQSLMGAAIPTLLAISAILFYAKDLNILSLGDELATSKGVDVKKTMRRLFILVAIIIAAVVSIAGPIGFIGLIIPHAFRLWLGPDNRYLIPGVFFGGAVFLMISDTVARLILAPVELPVGVLTAILGGPFFIILLFKRRNEILGQAI